MTRIAPECGGLEISYLREGLAFTWLTTGVQVALLDGVQYLDGGPCVEASQVGEAVPADAQSALSEEQWALFAKIAASGGVRSTLSLPFVRDGAVVGGVNLYGTTEDTFEGRREPLGMLMAAQSVDSGTAMSRLVGAAERAEIEPLLLAHVVVKGRLLG